MKTGLVTDARFQAHRAPWDHPERPERLAAIERELAESGLMARAVAVPARPATREELEGAHSPAYLDVLEAEVKDQEGWIDADTYFCPASWEAALLAAGGATELALRVHRGELDNGLALVRPPGHHATRERAMGFCLVNNVAVAAARLRKEGARVAIMDWDVHHGNGTEDIFDADEQVLFVSTHEWPQYPGTGPSGYELHGAGPGATLHVTFPHGTDDQTYLAAYEERIRPVIEGFAPDLILVSMGFDAHNDDPLGGLRLTEAAYAHVTRHLLSVQPRLVAVLEGGYDLGAISRSTRRVLEILLGDPP